MTPETKITLRSTVPFFLVVSLVWTCWLVLTLYNQITEANMMNSTTLATEIVNSNAKNNATNSADPREAKWFNQALEHFNSSSSETTWPQVGSRDEFLYSFKELLIGYFIPSIAILDKYPVLQWIWAGVSLDRR